MAASWIAWAGILGTILLIVFLSHEYAKEDREKPKSEMDELRNAAFRVIEASLRNEPEKWEPQSKADKLHWLVNHESQTAVWVAGGEGSISILNFTPTAAGKPVLTTNRVTPPYDCRRMIWAAAKNIIDGTEKEKEIEQLELMVSGFETALAKAKEANNDPQGA
jgi:hypothetical protein